MASHSPWSYLPEEILDLIFDCIEVPIDILRCGTVCKSWRPAALQVYRKFFPLCFIQPDKFRDDDNFVLFNILNKETRKIQLPETKGKSILCGYNSWLLTLDHSNSSPKMHLLNIFSRTQILLPQLCPLSMPFLDRSVDLEGKLRLSKCPTISDCMILLFFYRGLVCSVLYCKPGCKEWRGYRIINPISDVIWHTSDIIACIKSPPELYALENRSFPVPELALTNIDGDFLVNSLNEHLWLVCYRRKLSEGKIFDVFKLEISAEEYRKVKGLDGCTLFISPNGCHLAKTGKFKANCIYFIRQSEGDCVIYDMETEQLDLVPFPGLVDDGKSLISWVVNQRLI